MNQVLRFSIGLSAAIGLLVALPACGDGDTGGVGGGDSTSTATGTATATGTSTGSSTSSGFSLMATCNAYLGASTNTTPTMRGVTGWKRGLPKSTFDTDLSYTAYTDLDGCACVQASGGTPDGCASDCVSGCAGNKASAACDTCVNAKCSGQILACQEN